MTTARVVADNFFDGARPLAYKLLGGLAGRRELYRHEAEGSGSYFTATPKALSEQTLRDRFAILWFCRIRPKPMALLSPRGFSEVIEELKSIVDLTTSPRFAPCVHSGEALLLLLVHRSRSARQDDDLNRALASLQDYVASSTFEPWWHFARHDLLSLVYIVRDAESRAELERWINRHPLISSLGGVSIPVPTIIAYAPMFPGAP